MPSVSTSDPRFLARKPIRFGLLAWLASPIAGAMLIASVPSLAELPPLAVPVLVDAAAEIFPPSWRDDPHNTFAAPLVDPDEVDRTITALRGAMALYPDRFLKRHLRAVYVMRELRFDDITAAGTNTGRSVYVANSGVEEGFTDRFIAEIFHHEFSSVLLRRHGAKFDREAWYATLPSDFEYGESGVAAVRSGKASQRFDENRHRDGFLHEYASSALEEDFNSIAESLFGGRIAFWRAVDRYPRLKSKVGVAIRFYGGLDPMFSEAFFRGLVPQPVEV